MPGESDLSGAIGPAPAGAEPTLEKGPLGALGQIGRVGIPVRGWLPARGSENGRLHSEPHRPAGFDPGPELGEPEPEVARTGEGGRAHRCETHRVQPHEQRILLPHEDLGPIPGQDRPHRAEPGLRKRAGGIRLRGAEEVEGEIAGQRPAQDVMNRHRAAKQCLPHREPEAAGIERGRGVGRHELGVVGEIGAAAVVERVDQDPAEDLELHPARGANLRLGLRRHLLPDQFDRLFRLTKPLGQGVLRGGVRHLGAERGRAERWRGGGGEGARRPQDGECRSRSQRA